VGAQRGDESLVQRPCEGDFRASPNAVISDQKVAFGLSSGGLSTYVSGTFDSPAKATGAFDMFTFSLACGSSFVQGASGGEKWQATRNGTEPAAEDEKDTGTAGPAFGFASDASRTPVAAPTLAQPGPAASCPRAWRSSTRSGPHALLPARAWCCPAFHAPEFGSLPTDGCAVGACTWMP
jgi:hypothetical protein